MTRDPKLTMYPAVEELCLSSLSAGILSFNNAALVMMLTISHDLQHRMPV